MSDVALPVKYLIAWAVEQNRHGVNYLTLTFQWKFKGDESRCVYDHYLTPLEEVVPEISLEGFVSDYDGTLVGFTDTECTTYRPNAGKLRRTVKVMERVDSAVSKGAAKDGDYSKASAIYNALNALKVEEVRYRKLGQHQHECITKRDLRNWVVRLVDDVQSRWAPASKRSVA